MHLPRWLLEERPDASAHHAVAVQAPHPPVSRRSFHSFAPLLHGGGFTSQPTPIRRGGRF
jgi:hypothetical protein